MNRKNSAVRNPVFQVAGYTGMLAVWRRDAFAFVTS